MINKDKFGKPIYDYVFKKLLEYGRALVRSGYQESQYKPNLFYRSTTDARFFADMRGTDMVPIWSEPVPLFYWSWRAELPLWKKRRLIVEEVTRIFQHGCRWRFSEEAHHDEACPDVMIDEQEGGICSYEYNDGYCKVCGKDFQDDGVTCSSACAEEYAESLKQLCPACNQRFDTAALVKHHISYTPEKTVKVCRACHIRIHNTNNYPDLKPRDKRVIGRHSQPE